MAETQTATIGGGCFWCIESALNMVKGVVKAESGYAGGELENPTYQQICSGNTGHAEVVQVEFDPQVLSFEVLLELFFQLHDPTQLNRQGNDVGTQYRSVILYHNKSQKQQAEAKLQQLTNANIWPEPIVTELAPLLRFYPAEDYHQGYALTNPNQPYCALVVTPKLNKFQHEFRNLLKTS